MVRRRGRDDDRRPHRFDPDQRGRDFPNKRRRRGRGQQTLPIERRVADIETWSRQTIRVALQSPADSPIQIVTELPEPNQLDIGRQIIVRSLAALRDVLYIGMQQDDGAVKWVQWTSSYEGSGVDPSEAGDLVRVTFVQHIPLGVNVVRCSATTDYVYYTYEGGNVRRVSRTTGAISDPVAGGFPNVTQAYGIHAEDDGKIWVAISNAAFTSGSVKHWNGTSVVTSATFTPFVLAIDRSPVTGKIFTGGGQIEVGPPYPFGRWRLTPSTLATEDSSTGSGSGYGVTGVAVSAGGQVFWIHATEVIVTDENLDIITTFNSSASIYGPIKLGRNPDFDGNGRLYMPDSIAGHIKVFNDSGVCIGVFGVVGTGAGQFNDPRDITIHGNTLWVADRLNKRLSEWTIS